MVDRLVQKLEFDDFWEVLPELRLAFNYFVPSETNAVAQKVAALYHTDSMTVQTPIEIYNELYAQGAELEQEICRALGEEAAE